MLRLLFCFLIPLLCVSCSTHCKVSLLFFRINDFRKKKKGKWKLKHRPWFFYKNLNWIKEIFFPRMGKDWQYAHSRHPSRSRGVIFSFITLNSNLLLTNISLFDMFKVSLVEGDRCRSRYSNDDIDEQFSLCAKGKHSATCEVCTLRFLDIHNICMAK